MDLKHRYTRISRLFIWSYTYNEDVGDHDDDDDNNNNKIRTKYNYIETIQITSQLFT